MLGSPGIIVSTLLMGPAPASSVTLSPEVDHVLNKEITLPSGTSVPPGDYKSIKDNCTLTPAAKPATSATPAATVLKGDCKVLWDLDLGVVTAAARPKDLDLTGPNDATLIIKFDRLVLGDPIPAKLTGNSEYTLDNKAITKVYEKIGKIVKAVESKNEIFDLEPTSTKFVFLKDQLHLLEVKPVVKKPDEKEPDFLSLTDREALAKCRDAVGFSDSLSVCVNIDAQGGAQIAYIPPRFRDQVLPPNTTLEVFTVADSRFIVNGQLGGDPGLFEPGTRSYNGNEPTQTLGVPAKGEDKKATAIVRRLSFAPRLPSSAVPLTIEVSKKGEDKPRTTRFEFVVERTYSGAIRLGIGVLVGSAVDVDYSGERLGNAMQPEIIAKSDSRFEFEFVAGYAPFIFDMIRGKKGRRYHNTSLRERSLGFAPYIGLGVINVARAADVEFFRSVHLGLEWEPMPNFSIAITAVGRRVTRLQDGLHVGSPIAGSDVPTRERIAWGAAIVLNLTPEFFRFAARESTNLLRPTP